MYEIRYYVTLNDKRVFAEWQRQLHDPKAEAAVIRRIGRMEQGNFGDHKYLAEGVSELRIDIGPGYRAYYAMAGKRIVLLLCGGDKKSQRADIDRAASTGKTGRNDLQRQVNRMSDSKMTGVLDRSYDEIVVESLRANPQVAVELLNSILEDGDQAELLIALRQLTRAFGGVSAVAEKSELNPTQLYRTLSEHGNPALSTLAAILKTMGLRLAVQRIKPIPRKRSKAA